MEARLGLFATVFFAIFGMADINEQRICNTFRFKLGKNAVDTYWMSQQAFGDQALSRARTFANLLELRDNSDDRRRRLTQLQRT